MRLVSVSLSLTSTENIQAQATSGSHSLGSPSDFGAPLRLEGRGNALIGMLFASNIVFNLTDLATTYFALGSGLGEGNKLLLVMSSTLGVGIFASLLAIKVAFVSGAAIVALVALRSESKTRRNSAICYLLTSAVVFYAVSLNNVFWIVS
jgi:hypothetical protein